MSIKPLIILPDPILRQVSRPVERVDSALLKFTGDMLDTMYDAPGIGLAAIQIGEPLRMLVIDLAREDEPAAPQVFISDRALLAALEGQDLAEIAITSGITVTPGEGPADAFRLEEVPGVAVVSVLAEGRRCARSWKILPEVGSDAEYSDLSPRDAQAMRERKAAGLPA